MTNSEKTRSPVDLKLRRLAGLHGIKPEWRDLLGNIHLSSETAIKQALSACGVIAATESEVSQALRRADEIPLQPVYVIEPECETDLALHLPGSTAVNWRLSGDDGVEEVGEVKLGQESADGGRAGSATFHVHLPALDAGYYSLVVELSPSHQMLASRLIVAPSKCFVSRDAGVRTWGPLVRLSTLRSQRNWGIGDFSDLENLCATALEKGGAGIISLEPIQPVLKSETSQFSSLSFIDPIYLDVEAISDFSESEEAKRSILSPDFQQMITTVRDSDVVDFSAVRQIKNAALLLIYQNFRQQHVANNSSRAQDFRHFQQEQGQSLRLFAIYQALSEQLGEDDWRNWPEQFRDLASGAVCEFIESNSERIEFFEYLQWIADGQMRSIGLLCSSAHASLGMCRSVPFSFAPGGFEAWRNRELVAARIAAVTPAAMFEMSPAAGGCALIPEALRKVGYAPYVEALRAAQRYSGAVFISEISACECQLWRLEDRDELVEVQYPLNELLAVLKLESHRARCLVLVSGMHELELVTEHSEGDVFDRLGIIPVKAKLSSVSLPLSRNEKAIAPQGACAIIPRAHGNHSLVSYWLGADVPAQGLAAGVEKTRDSVVAQRVLERVDVLRRLEERSFLPVGSAVDPTYASMLSLDVSIAFYKMMATEQASLLLLPLEDLSSKYVMDKVVSQYRPAERLALSTADVLQQNAVVDLIAAMRKAGRTGVSTQDATDSFVRVQATIPDATYRFQFNKDFTLRQAEELIPYLDELGVTHCYASPLLMARPGSMHGYDIVNHGLLNPEIGAPEDLESFCHTLKKHRMGLILDLVPNHMGIGKENPWWVDVLENGPASQFAEYFDIDWMPIKRELQGKVTIPILGEFYGNILHSGQLKLHFYPERGALVLRYYENEYPINPRTYPQVLAERVDVLKERLGADNFDVMEYQSIVTAYMHLPGHMEPRGFSERIREKKLQMRRLAELCKRNPAIVEFIEQNLRLFEVQSGDRAATQRLHALLESQAYRLVQWRVANDEINYRRFFDINDLAAVRTEDPRVFAEMHALVMKWIAERKIDGLRIDHPDGLYDPAAYFKQLQQTSAERLGGAHSVDETSYRDLPFYVLVEKILAPYERLEDWAVQGTTGYDYMNDVLGVLIRTESEDAFSKIYESIIGRSVDYEEMKRECKRIILDSVLASELNVLAHRISQIAESSWYFRDFTLNSLRSALRQIVIAFPVYRTYVNSEQVDKTAYQFIDWAIGKAKRVGAANSPAVYDFIRSVLTLEAKDSPFADNDEEDKDFARAVQTYAMKFQQFTGPVMAKSFEDTLFYRYFRFAALNEVGGEPERFGLTVSAFHQRNFQRQQRQPYSMLATSTHDTKRSEDVRSRLAVISELPDVWEQRINYWMRMNKSKKAPLEGENAPDNNDEYLIYQTIIGAYPFALSQEEQIAQFRDRIKQYVLKAVREAKRHTSWVNQNLEYETALTNFIDRILTPSSTNTFLDELAQFEAVLSPLGLLNGLVQTVLKLTSPGVPDIYQGNEAWDFSLVDPDNRRPVDYGLRKKMLKDMRSFLEPTGNQAAKKERVSFVADCLAHLNDGRLKMYFTSCLLRLRRLMPRIFTDGKYLQLESSGAAAEHVLAFARELDGRWVIVVVPHLVATLLGLNQPEMFKQADPDSLRLRKNVWGDTSVVLPDGFAANSLVNVFTSELIEPTENRLMLTSLFETIPFGVFADNSVLGVTKTPGAG